MWLPVWLPVWLLLWFLVLLIALLFEFTKQALLKDEFMGVSKGDKGWKFVAGVSIERFNLFFFKLLGMLFKLFMLFILLILSEEEVKLLFVMEDRFKERFLVFLDFIFDEFKLEGNLKEWLLLEDEGEEEGDEEERDEGEVVDEEEGLFLFKELVLRKRLLW